MTGSEDGEWGPGWTEIWLGGRCRPCRGWPWVVEGMTVGAVTVHE